MTSSTPPMQLLRKVELLRKKLSEAGSPLNNNEIWSIQQELQVTCGQLLVSYQESALESGVERDLWNFGFKTTVTQLQSETKDKKKGGGNEATKDVLNWFLNAASGFYLQLLNQISSTYSLDLVFRRKDSIYGLVGGGLSNTIPGVKVKDSVTKNALYLCQYCLIHLGDLARYRHQAKQAETYYRHAVTVAATSGHPYNQLALLEAGRGNRLASVFLYIRALCVTAPFPGAPSNLIQTLTKVINNRVKDEKIMNCGEIKIGTLTRMTKEEYINLFLHFHSCLFLKGDVETSKEDLPCLSSALSMLVATTTLTRSSLVQMFAINVFAFYYFSGKFTLHSSDDHISKKEEEKLIEPKECEGALEILEDLMFAMLAALLLPIHTMKEPEVVLTYAALPAIRFMFEWILFEEKLLSPSLKKKQQIWPGLCSLVNFLQQPLASFEAADYKETPLPEDWDLQGFQPLQKILARYKYRESLPRLMPDQYSLLRAKRLTDLASKFSQETLEGGPVIRKASGNNETLKFEAQANQSPPVEEVLDLERLTLQPQHEVLSNGKRREKVGILKPQGSLERSKEVKEAPQHTKQTLILKDTSREQKKVDRKAKVLVGGEDKRITIGPSGTSILAAGDSVAEAPNNTINVRPRTRTNVALQAILKRNSTTQEAKQVTFQTPSPAASPNPSDASSESQRSQLSTPPPPPSLTMNQQLGPSSPHVTPLTLGLQLANSSLGLLNGPNPGSPNVQPSRFPTYRGLEHSSSLGNQPYAMPLNQQNQMRPRMEYPFGAIRPSQNSNFVSGATGKMSEMSMGSFSQGVGMIRQGSLPQQMQQLQTPLQNIFKGIQNNSFVSDAPNQLYQKQETSVPAYGKPQPSNNWVGGSTSESMLMSNMQGTQEQSSTAVQSQLGIQRSLEPTFKDINQRFNQTQFPNPPPHMQQNYQPPFQQQMRFTPSHPQEVEGRGGIRSSPPLPIYRENTYLPQQNARVPLPQNANPLFAQASNLSATEQTSSNFFPATPGNSWWQKEPNNQRSPPYPFSQLSNRPPPPPPTTNLRNLSPSSIDTSVPPPPLGSHYQNISLNPNTSGISTSLPQFSPDHKRSNELNNGSLRVSNTYSLFGPLGGGETVGHSLPPPHMPAQQQSHQSLWSGPSPLQRLLEQKKFSSTK